MSMIEGFRTVLSDLTSASRSFSGDHSTASDLAGRLSGLGAVDTGDQSLNGRIESGLSDCAAVFTKMAETIQLNADGLTVTADSYSGIDATVAGRFADIQTDGAGQGTPVASTNAPAGDLGIAEKLVG